MSKENEQEKRRPWTFYIGCSTFDISHHSTHHSPLTSMNSKVVTSEWYRLPVSSKQILNIEPTNTQCRRKTNKKNVDLGHSTLDVLHSIFLITPLSFVKANLEYRTRNIQCRRKTNKKNVDLGHSTLDVLHSIFLTTHHSPAVGLLPEVFLNGQPHLALFTVELLVQSQTRRFTPGLFVGSAQGAEVQVPQPACKHAVFVIDEQGMTGGVVNNAIELVNDGLGEGLGRNLQPEE